jgi:IS30 family transposase
MPKGHALTEDQKDGIWELRVEGLSERQIGFRLGLAPKTVSQHVASLGGIRPRPRRRAERCLSLEEREEISRGIAGEESDRAIGRRLGRSHTTIAREINRCGGRRAYRSHAADREAWRRARRPRPTKLELCPELRREVEERLCDDHSPEQIAGWLRLAYPDNESMQVSHETIYRALYVQGRGALKRELARHLRRGRSKRYARSQSSKRSGQGKLTEMVMISERPPEVDDRAVPGHWEGDLVMGNRQSAAAIATLVERQTRYLQLVALPEGTEAERVADALAASITTLPAQLRRSLTGTKAKRWQSTGALRSSRTSTSTSAIPEAPGSAAPTRTPTACFASTSRGDRASPASPRSSPTRSRQSSTAGPERRSAFGPRQKSSKS